MRCDSEIDPLSEAFRPFDECKTYGRVGLVDLSFEGEHKVVFCRQKRASLRHASH